MDGKFPEFPEEWFEMIRFRCNQSKVNNTWWSSEYFPFRKRDHQRRRPMPSSFSLYFSPVLLAEIYRCSIAVKHPNSCAISCHSDWSATFCGTRSYSSNVSPGLTRFHAQRDARKSIIYRLTRHRYPYRLENREPVSYNKFPRTKKE